MRLGKDKVQKSLVRTFNRYKKQEVARKSTFVSDTTFRCKNVIRTSVTLSYHLVCHFFFLPHFDIICDLLLNRCTRTWNLFVKQIPSPAVKLFYFSSSLTCVTQELYLSFEHCVQVIRKVTRFAILMTYLGEL